MKTWNVIVKIVVALAAIAGIVYIAATYGDKIVAWARKLLSKFSCCCGGCECDCDCQCECDCEEAEEAIPSETAVEAGEQDFEG